MVAPYMAVGIQSSTHYVKSRREMKKNLETACNLLDRAIHICGGELPVKLVALPEGAITGWQSYHMDYDTFTRDCAIDVPGEETERLGEKAREYGAFVIAQALARMPQFPGRCFNTNFILNPRGEVIYTQRKNAVFIPEHSTTPQDVYDQWVELFGDGLDAFFPVARTEIGNLAAMNCFEGSFPESFRAFALNGAEVIYRPTYLEPYVSQEWYEIQNRGGALANACYVLSPNIGAVYEIDGSLLFPSAGHSMMVDYRGQVVAHIMGTSDTFICAPIDIELLRHHRFHGRAFFLSQIRAEIYRKLYDEPIWPKNSPSADIGEKVRMHRQVIQELVRRGICVPPRESPWGRGI